MKFSPTDQIELTFAAFLVPDYDYKNLGDISFDTALQNPKLGPLLFPSPKPDQNVNAIQSVA
jgi:hypothetical protein